jgi:hypothetical protein
MLLITLNPGEQVSAGAGWYRLDAPLTLAIERGGAVGIADQPRRVVMLHPDTYTRVWGPPRPPTEEEPNA